MITQPMKNEVFVLGQVKFPNQFRFDQEKVSLLKALSMAGGVMDDTADLHSVKIISDDGTSRVVDLEKLLASEQQQNIFLSPGDVVYIPKKEFIRVTGYVITPCEYKTKNSIGVTQALALAGGPMQDMTDLSNALIIRSTGEIVNIKLNDDFGSKDNQNEAYMLSPGDTLYVPNVYKVEEVNVIGYVRSPGKYKVKKPLSLFETLTVTAFDGSEGLAKARSERPDLILLDIIMPVVDGIDVCVKLKANKATMKIPIIIFSALSGNLAIMKSYKAGANDYVVKPFNLSALLNKMNRLITNKQD